jgi:carboxypeptidase Taq
MSPELLNRIHELRDLYALLNLASWDQETCQPKKAEAARADQLATLQCLAHERLVDPRVGDWLAAATPASVDEAALLRVVRRERDRAVKLDTRLVKALAEAQGHGLSAWKEARAEGRFERFRPALEHLVSLRREQADAWGHDGERYDALLEAYEPGMRVARLTPVLQGVASKLKPLVDAIAQKPPPVDPFAGKRFDVERQWAFTMELLRTMGFDLDAGRQDRSVHPFTSGFHALDVRLTTRLDPATPLPALFATIHEGGHGLYEQGFSPADARTHLAQAPSMGLHESQSRLWENIVGRSHGFWEHFYPKLRRVFPSELSDVSLDTFVAAVNRVEKSFIRVEADEVTYNLHIVLRYELELALLRGTLEVKDLEAAWNEKTTALLGLTVKTPLDGVLQDIHWSSGDFGYFPTYALGNLYAASIYGAARRDLKELDQQLSRGELWPLREWLRTHIHAPGWRCDAEELVTRVTGQGLTDASFVANLTSKYGRLYAL